MLIQRIALSAAAFLTAALTAGTALSASPVSIGLPVADPIVGVPGTGLCIASAKSQDPDKDFGLLTNTTSYNSGVNDFIETKMAPDRVESVVRTLLDLSNNNDTGAITKPSYGDFIDIISPYWTKPPCKSGGCDFFLNDTTSSFGARIRGFMNVGADLVGKKLHFGFYTDDAVSMTFRDAQKKVYEVVTRPLKLGAPAWRTTNTVTFTKAGLYPLEILYVQIVEHAALEMSYYIGDYPDFELPITQAGSPNLKTDGFTLFEPVTFFQTLSGDPSFPDVTKCTQCNRDFVGSGGNNGCNDPGYYCNEAALCAPCDSDKLCGDTCSPCGGDTKFCINVNGKAECGACREDFDCKEGFTCDQVTHQCNECEVDSQCDHGEICEDHSCVPCATPDECAGNSCNCCPNAKNGKQMQCALLEKNGAPSCVECLTTVDCDTGFCDTLTGHCVEELKPNATPECCGEGCVNCAAQEPIGQYPFCLPGPIGTACAQCRHDMDCVPTNVPEGATVEAKFCLSGQCQSCTRDRRCGERCISCGGDTPYCMGQTSASAECVRCTNDSQCNGGTCDPKTNECLPGCPAACTGATPYCDGQKCVGCYADTQCPCNATCDLSTNTCSPSCKTNVDCLGNEHCRWTESETEKECALGPMPGDVACGGTLATACAGSIGDNGRRRDGEAPPVGIVGLALLALLGRRRLRGTL